MRSEMWKRLWRSDLPWRLAAATVLLVSTGFLVDGFMAAWAAEAKRPPEHTKLVHKTKSDAGVESVTKHLMCTCGCNLTVAACEAAMTCDVSKKMREEAAEKLSSGMKPGAVLASFAEDYGEAILAAPTKTGFNLTAWVAPFAALGGGLLVVAVALLKWRRKKPDGGDDDGSEPEAEIDPTYAALIDEQVARGM